MMQSKNTDGTADDRIGGAPFPMTQSQKIMQQILELQNQLRSLERDYQRAARAEEIAKIRAPFYSDFDE